MVTPGMNDTGLETTLIVSGRVASGNSSAVRSPHSGIPFDPDGRAPSGKGLINAPAAFDNALYGPNHFVAALRDGEAKSLRSTYSDRNVCIF